MVENDYVALLWQSPNFSCIKFRVCTSRFKKKTHGYLCSPVFYNFSKTTGDPSNPKMQTKGYNTCNMEIMKPNWVISLESKYVVRFTLNKMYILAE